jgi:hypothetical protein
MLENTALIGAIKYIIGEIKYLQTSPHTGITKNIVITFDDLSRIASDAMCNVKLSASKPTEQRERTKLESNDVYRALITIKKLMQP